MLDTLEVYKHSGRLGGAPIVVLLAGIVSGLVLAVVFGYCAVDDPTVGWV